jgi:two-component system chemotaxis response regulator CheY
MPRSALIVDDSRLIRAIVRNMLEPIGFTVSEAASGREALLQCEAKSPALIVLDWWMDDMNGPDVAAAIRARNDVPQPRILLCSTETRGSEIRRAMRAGADSYLLKPFDKDKIAHRLQRFGFL